jgi:hypothetical protein
MTEETRIIKIFESFTLGVCKCGCRQEIIRIRTNKTLRRFVNGHNNRRENKLNWKGGKFKKRNYVYVLKPDHPYCDKWGYVRENRFVMEEYLKRYLNPDEVVHHKNRIRDDNRIDNLELFSYNAEHLKTELTVDKNNRICLLCNGKTVLNKKNRHEYWYKFEDGFICNRCYLKFKRK